MCVASFVDPMLHCKPALKMFMPQNPGTEAMDVDGGDGATPAKKRVHSSKSRCVATH